MLKKKLVEMAVIAMATMILVSGGAQKVTAHHGWSEYDSNQALALTGEIQSISYDSPHVVIQLKAPNGMWSAVLAPPSRMQSRGLPQEALQVGQTVRLVGYPHRTEPNEMRAEQITLGDETVELR